MSYLLDRLITGNMAYHLYFIIIIMQFYLVYPLICKMFKKFNNNILMLIFCIIHVFCYIYIPMKHRFFGNYIAYFTLGCYFAFNYEKIIDILKNKKFKYVSIAVVLVATVYYIFELYIQIHFKIILNPTNSTWQIFSFITIPGYYVLSMLIDKSSNVVIKYLKENLVDISVVSFGVYLMHPYVIIILQRKLANISLAWRYVAITTIVLLLTVLYSKIIKYKNKKIKRV